MKYIIILILFLFAFKVKEPSYYIGQVMVREDASKRNWGVAEIIRAEDLHEATIIFNKFLATDSVMKRSVVTSAIFIWKIDFDRSPITEKYLTPVKEVK